MEREEVVFVGGFVVLAIVTGTVAYAFKNFLNKKRAQEASI